MNKQTDFIRSPSGRYVVQWRGKTDPDWYSGLARTLNTAYDEMLTEWPDFEQYVVPVENRDSDD